MKCKFKTLTRYQYLELINEFLNGFQVPDYSCRSLFLAA